MPFLGTGEQWGSDHGSRTRPQAPQASPAGDQGASSEPLPCRDAHRLGGAGFLPLTLAVVSLRGALRPPLISGGNFCQCCRAAPPPPSCSRVLGPPHTLPHPLRPRRAGGQQHLRAGARLQLQRPRQLCQALDRWARARLPLRHSWASPADAGPWSHLHTAALMPHS